MGGTSRQSSRASLSRSLSTALFMNKNRCRVPLDGRFGKGCRKRDEAQRGNEQGREQDLRLDLFGEQCAHFLLFSLVFWSRSLGRDMVQQRWNKP